MKLKFKIGLSLIEVVIALAVVVTLAVSLIATSLVTQKSSVTARNNSQATKLVQQNIEQVRILRDRRGFSYLATITDGSCYTLNTSNADPLNWSLDPCSTGETITFNNVPFTRKIALATSAANKKSITITVTWTDSGGTQTVNNVTYLSDWEGAQ